MPGGGGDSRQAQFAAQMKYWGKRPHVSKPDAHVERLAELNKLKALEAVNALNRMRERLLVFLHTHSSDISRAAMRLLLRMIRFMEKLRHLAAGSLAGYGSGGALSAICVGSGGTIDGSMRGPPSSAVFQMIEETVTQIKGMNSQEINQLERELEEHPKVQLPSRIYKFLKKAIAYFLIGTALVGPAYAQNTGMTPAITGDKTQNMATPGNGSAGILPNGQTASFYNNAIIGYLPNGAQVARPGYVSPQQQTINAAAANELQKQNTQRPQFSPEYQRLKKEAKELVQNNASIEIIRKKAENAERILNTFELSRIYNGLGNELQEQKNYSEALFYYKKASDLGPKYKEHFEDIINSLEKEIKK